jgi:hypothetical protein
MIHTISHSRTCKHQSCAERGCSCLIHTFLVDHTGLPLISSRLLQSAPQAYSTPIVSQNPEFHNLHERKWCPTRVLIHETSRESSISLERERYGKHEKNGVIYESQDPMSEAFTAAPAMTGLPFGAILDLLDSLHPVAAPVVLSFSPNLPTL